MFSSIFKRKPSQVSDVWEHNLPPVLNHPLLTIQDAFSTVKPHLPRVTHERYIIPEGRYNSELNVNFPVFGDEYLWRIQVDEFTGTLNLFLLRHEEDGAVRIVDSCPIGYPEMALNDNDIEYAADKIAYTYLLATHGI